jgi:BMFP domain-containing protein YqiC
MLNKKVLDGIGSKVTEILEHSPAKDVEKNLKVVLSGAFSRLDLVKREEFDVQQEVLLRTREKLTALESKVAALEEQLGLSTPDAAAAAAPDEPKNE